MESKNWIDLNADKIKSDEYFSKLVIQFPALKKEIENEDCEMIYSRMDIFSNYSILQIDTKNITELKRCFDFQESLVEKLNSDLINALHVSYCESLLLGKSAAEMSEIINYMPPKLKTIYIDYENYYIKLAKK